MAVERLRLVLELAAKKFNAGFKRAGAAVKAFASKLNRMKVGIAIAAVAFGAAVKSVTNFGEELSLLSERIGIGVEKLSELKFIAEQNGASLQDMTAALEGLSRNALDASNGIGVGVLAFKQLDIEVKNSEGNLKGAEELFLEIADAMSKFKDGSAKSALAQKLMTTAGAKLIPTLNQGSEGFKALAKRGRELGIILTEEDAAASRDFNDTLNELKNAMFSLLREAIIPMLPNLKKLTNFLINAAIKARKFTDAVLELASNITGFLFESFFKIQAEIEKFVINLSAGIDAVPILIKKALTFFDDAAEAELQRRLDAVIENRKKQIAAVEENLRVTLESLLAPGEFRGQDPAVARALQQKAARQQVAAPTGGPSKEEIQASKDAAARALADQTAAAELSLLVAQRLGADKMELIKLETAFLKASLAEALNDETLTANQRKVLAEQTNQEILALMETQKEDMTEISEQMADDMANVFVDSFFDTLNGEAVTLEGIFQNLGDVMQNIAKEALAELTKVAIKAAIVKAIGSGATAAAQGGIVGLAKGGIAGARYGSIARMMAGGGTTRGPAIAGEAGPEAVVPLPDGKTIPVDLKGSAGAGTIELTIVNEIQGQRKPQNLNVAQRADVLNVVAADALNGGLIRRSLRKANKRV